MSATTAWSCCEQSVEGNESDSFVGGGALRQPSISASGPRHSSSAASCAGKWRSECKANTLIVSDRLSSARIPSCLATAAA
jgi:hypothetical protein